MSIEQQQGRSTDKLTQSEERFRALVNATSDVVYRMSPDWGIMRQLTGGEFLSDTGEPIDNWMEKYIHPEDLDKVHIAISEAIRTKTIFSLEHRVQRADGSMGWTFSRAVPILNEAGEIIEWFGAANDVSGRKQTELALNAAKELAEQQKRLYETITSGTPDLIYVFDLDYKFTYANEALLTMWGKSWENAIGRKLLENGYEPWHAEMHEREIDTVVETKKPIRGEVSFPHAQFGRRIYDYIFTPVINEQGVVEAVAGTTRDITEIRQAEITLAESEARFRNMAEGSNIYIAMSDETGKIIYFNQAWLKFTGKSEQELLNFNWTDLLHPDDHEKHLSIYRDAIRAELPFHDSYRLRTSDGEYRWLLVDGSVRRYSDGSFAGHIGAAVDITGLKEDEQRKNDFISMVSHELKTPLTSTLAYIQLSKERVSASNDDLTHTMLTRTEKQIRKMTGMINSFLNLSRLESGKIQVEPVEFDLGALINEIRQEFMATISSHKVIFHPFETACILGDHEKIAQVIQNLISNATKYSAKNTPVEISVINRDGEVEISVEDKGVGIRQEDLTRVFERFYRVHDFETRNISGFGIGLYLCAEIIKRHGGKIWVESELGKGSTFRFTLPVCGKKSS
ncbi:PAS domain S-box protein [Terrimonas sp. NA20]|uniref:histidine kinase n=1 Tax=Terrimonas ginsenosidimutans TaxID=2908004 RepID=A0ABS9KM12_9BACT|nr:PAS domain S-box protein [Terrimonas ginsenosidimutans]MCG2613353.1 PAS domain S-box protein [Terrimonas ginsenosidimutans]